MAVRYYKDCSQLPIYNFHKVLETDNYAYLVFGWDEWSKTFHDHEYCKELWNDIYSEYCLIAEDNTSLFYYETFKDVVYLETRFEIVSKILMQLCISENTKDENIMLVYKDALNKWKYDIDLSKPLEDELSRLERELKFSLNKIELKKNELEQLKGEEEEKRTFTREVVEMEIAMNKDFIDPKLTSVLKWREMIDAMKERNRKMKSKVYG